MAPGPEEYPRKGFDEIAGMHFDLAMATWWESVYSLPKVSADAYGYFVQNADFLLAPKSDRRAAELTYSFGLGIVTVSRSLGQALAGHYGLRALVAVNGMNKEVFRPSGPTHAARMRGRIRMLIEGPMGGDTKGVAYAIRLARKAGADEIWLLTSSPITWYPGVDRVFSGVVKGGVAPVYRSCDVLLKLSSLESCSLPIVEMMHCGGAVIAYDIPSPNEYLVHNENSLLVPMGDEEAIIDALRRLRREPELLNRLIAGGLKTADAWPDWETSSDVFLQCCQRLYAQERTRSVPLRVAADVQRPHEVTSVRSLSLTGLFRSLLAVIKRIGSKSSLLRSLWIIARARLFEQRSPIVASIWINRHLGRDKPRALNDNRGSSAVHLAKVEEHAAVGAER